jgi:amino acid transporter
MMNGAYYSFAKLGAYYGIGNFFVVIYAISTGLSQAATLAIAIDAPLRILLGDVDSKYIPKAFTKKSANGTPINGYKLTAVLVSILIIVPALGIGDMTNLYNWLIRLNAVCMPLRYMWVFFAYMALKQACGRFTSEYQFVKSPKIGFYSRSLVFPINRICMFHGYVSTRNTCSQWKLVLPIHP